MYAEPIKTARYTILTIIISEMYVKVWYFFMSHFRVNFWTKFQGKYNFFF